MRTRSSTTTALLFLLTLVSTPVGGQVSTHERDEERLAMDWKAIEALTVKDITATKAYDVGGLVSLWTDDIVALPPGGEPVIGKEANRKMLEAGRAQMAGIEILEYTMEWEEVRVAGDFAFQWGFISSAVRPVGSDEVMRYRYKALRVLQRQPDGPGLPAGGWLVHRTIWNEAGAETQ